MTYQEHLIERLYEFFLGFQGENVSLEYLIKIDRMTSQNEKSLYVDLTKLESFDKNILDELEKNPREFLNIASDSIKQVILGRDPEYLQNIKNVVHFRGYNAPERFFRTLGYLEKKSHSDDRLIKNLDFNTLGTLISTEGIITKVSETKFLLEYGAFRCDSCQALQPTVHFVDDTYNPPKSCINKSDVDISCNSKSFSLLKRDSTFTNFQKITLQESPENVERNLIPQNVVLFIRDDLCNRIIPGNRVKILGILDARVDGPISKGKMPVFNKFIEVISFEILDQDYEDLEINENDENEIKRLSKLPEIFTMVGKTISPSLYGLEIERETIGYTLFGGVPKFKSDGTRTRGESHVLLIGDPGQGKSQILRSIKGLVPKAIYTSGMGVSGVGLTAAVLKDPENETYHIEAGATVLADNGITLIDEFDKMRREDRGNLHEVMEDSRVSIAKAGLLANMNARTSVIAAANPKLTRWNLEKGIIENLNLPASLISRFDVIFPLIDIPDEITDELKANNIIRFHQGRENTIIGNVIEKELLRKYISYAKKNIFPILTPEADLLLKKFYIDLRMNRIRLSDNDLQSELANTKYKAMPITPRQLESIIRLAEGRARIALRNEITEEDIKRICEIYTISMKRATGGDIDTLYGMSAQKRNKRETVLNIIEELSEKGIPADIDDVVRKSTEEGLSSEDARDMIDQLLQNGEIYEGKPGKFKKMSD